MKRITYALGLLFFIVLLRAQTSTLPDIELVPFASGLDQPVGIEHAGDSRLFVVQQTGKIMIVTPNGKVKGPFLNLTDKISQNPGFEQGLLGLTFDPEYSDNGYFYVHYTNLQGNSRISRFNVNPNNPDKALPSSELIMWENVDPFRNHNSGQLRFGNDGYLYFLMGDGGSGGDPFNNAQNLSVQFGKLLRIDPTEDGYDIPPSNPYAGMPGLAGEIWASGLRNPWRFSFDALTGDLWLPDVGQNAWEEVNFTPASSTGGENYGWSCREGLHFFEADCGNNGIPFTEPIAEYAHDESGDFPCSGSITGGFIYRGAQYPNMYAKYFYTDFCTGVMRTVYWSDGDWVSADLGNFTPFAYSTFGQDINLELYLADKTAGQIYRFTDGGDAPFAHLPEENLVALHNNINHHIPTNDLDVDIDELIIGSYYQSELVTTPQQADLYKISPNPNHGNFTIHFTAEQPDDYTATVMNLMGHEILSAKKEIQKGNNEWEFNTSGLSEGIYLLQLRADKEISTIKFVVE